MTFLMVFLIPMTYDMTNLQITQYGDKILSSIFPLKIHQSINFFSVQKLGMVRLVILYNSEQLILNLKKFTTINFSKNFPVVSAIVY